MKRFIFETFCLLLAVALTAAFFEHRGRSELARAMRAASVPLNVINLGNSHGCNIDHTLLSVTGGAFNKAGNTLYYDLQNYRYLKPRLARNAVVIIPVSYFSFGLDENRTDRGANNGFENDFYEYLPKQSIYGYSGAKSRRLMVHRIQKGMRSLFGPPEEPSHPPGSGDEATQGQFLAQHAASRAEIHRRLAEYQPPARNALYLETLIKDAIESGFRPVLVATPFSASYNDLFPDDWLQTHYYSVIEKLQKAHAVPFLDYSRDPRFSPHPLFFGDSDHLSLTGKRIFSEIMWNDLVSIGCLHPEDLLATHSQPDER